MNGPVRTWLWILGAWLLSFDDEPLADVGGDDDDAQTHHSTGGTA